MQANDYSFMFLPFGCHTEIRNSQILLMMLSPQIAEKTEKSCKNDCGMLCGLRKKL